jgi:hypothetical protein
MRAPGFLLLEELAHTAAAQTSDGGDFSDRHPCTVGGHDSSDALMFDFVEPCGSQEESGLLLSFMPDTWSECFTSFHTLRILVYDFGAQQTGRDSTTLSFMYTVIIYYNI